MVSCGPQSTVGKTVGWKLLIRHCSVQAQSDWLYEVTITHLSITIIMTLHHITFVRCLVLSIPANLMTSNLRFGELLLSVGYCSSFAETRIVAYHVTCELNYPLLPQRDGTIGYVRNWSFVIPPILWLRYSHCDSWVNSTVLSLIL